MNMRRLESVRAASRASVIAVGCGWLAACGSGDGTPIAGGGGALQPTFSSIQANVLTPICEQCHSGAGAPRGLRLDAANSYALLVGAPSGEEPSILRVKPSDPANSYLIQKLEGRAGVGERMPAGLPPLPQPTIDTIRQWIADGAQQDTPQSTAPIRVTALSPDPGSVVAALPATITASFDRELNATTVDSTTFTIVRSGGDGVFDNGNDVAVAATVAVPANNRASAVATPSTASVNDDYRVTLSGNAPAAIMDLSGNALDGELSGTFPSGNGAAGGNFVATFRVGTLQPRLQSIQDGVFTTSCVGCHDGTGASLPRSMNLGNAAASRAALVGVASAEVPTLQRVQAGSAANSYLVQKLEGTPGIVGQRMPRGGAPFLDQVTVNVIRQWIDNGAP
jgi:hypothetical protein